MTDKSNFTPDEWKLILESVMMAGIAVSAAEPSGLWGLLKESFAGGTALVTAKMDSGSNPLIKAVVAEFRERRRSKHRARRRQRTAHGQQGRRDQGQVYRDAAAGWRGGRHQGAWRRGSLQGLAAPDQPTRCRSSHGGWISRHWWRAGERRREGNAHGDLKCIKTFGLTGYRAASLARVSLVRIGKDS
jgi:hypothetical protein